VRGGKKDCGRERKDKMKKIKERDRRKGAGGGSERRDIERAECRFV
jgi:hypothetical protein